jgi:hypothetical protein
VNHIPFQEIRDRITEIRMQSPPNTELVAGHADTETLATIIEEISGYKPSVISAMYVCGVLFRPLSNTITKGVPTLILHFRPFKVV